MGDSPKIYCTTREAATLLSVSVTTAQNWAESGLLESWKTEGGHRRISRLSIDRLIREPRTHRAILGGGVIRVATKQRLHILVIEDDPSLQRLYQLRMSSWSFAPIIDTATDGFEALVKIGIRCPDLLITDLNMPHIDGFQMLNTLASMPSCSEMHLLVVSGMSAADIAGAGTLPEGTRIFTKPAPFHELEQFAHQLAAAKKVDKPAKRQKRPPNPVAPT